MIGPNELIAGYLEGRLSEEQFAALGQWIAASPDHADLFTRWCILDQQLIDLQHARSLDVLLKSDSGSFRAFPLLDDVPELSELEMLDAVNDQMKLVEITREASAARPKPKPRRPSRRPLPHKLDHTPPRVIVIPRWVAFGTTAALLMLAALVGVNHFSNNPGDVGPGLTDGPSDAPPRIVAILLQTVGAVWNGTSPRVGADLHAGEYQLDKGMAQIELSDGGRVIVEAPATFALVDGSRIQLETGRLVGFCPPGVDGLTVHTPNAVITDLGTEFGVEVSAERESMTRVYAGEVELVGTSNGHTATAVTRLDAGKAVRVDPTGTKIETVDPATLQFARDADLALRRRGAELLTREAGLLHRWTFNDGTARDIVGNAHGQLFQNAVIRDGALHLDGKGAHMRSSRLDATLVDKTLVARVRLADLNQAGGGVLMINQGDSGNSFDGIVFGERHAGCWFNGSNDYLRSKFDEPLGPRETEADHRFVVIVLTYESDGRITLYRDGVYYGSHHALPIHTFPAAESTALIGYRHDLALQFDRRPEESFLHGEIDDVMIFRRALNNKEVEALSSVLASGTR